MCKRHNTQNRPHDMTRRRWRIIGKVNYLTESGQIQYINIQFRQVYSLIFEEAQS